MTIRLSKNHIEQIMRHGERTYPNECCGFLLGLQEGGVNILCEAMPAENEWQENINRVETIDEAVPAASQPKEIMNRESQKNRYWITPEQYRRADQHARDQGLGIIGYYHSHPDHPAEPSGYDLDHSCWPGESYIIVSIEQGRAARLNSFTKPDYEKFVQEEVIVENS